MSPWRRASSCCVLGLISFNVPTPCHSKVRDSQSFKPIHSNVLADNRQRLREVSTLPRAAQPGNSGWDLNPSLRFQGPFHAWNPLLLPWFAPCGHLSQCILAPTGGCGSLWSCICDRDHRPGHLPVLLRTTWEVQRRALNGAVHTRGAPPLCEALGSRRKGTRCPSYLALGPWVS